MFNNLDKEQRLHEWFSDIINSTHTDTHTYNTNTHRRERDLYSEWESIKKFFPQSSTKGNSKYHN